MGAWEAHVTARNGRLNVTAVDNFISLIRFLACSWPNLFLVAAKRGFKPDFLLCVMSHTQIKKI